MKLPSYPILSYPILSATWKCLQSMPSHHTLTSLSHQTSKPVKHTCDSQIGSHQHPWVVTILGARPFYNSNLEFCSDKKSGNCELEGYVSVGYFDKNFVCVFFVMCPDMAVWCAEMASVCGGGAWISRWWGCQYGGTTNIGCCTEPVETEEEKCVND